MSEIVFLVEDAPGGGFSARALGESIYTQAETRDALRVQVRDAVRCHFEDGQGPAVIRLHYVRDEILAAAKAGAIHHHVRSSDPIAAWMDLMEAVEILCPRWPPRLQRMDPAGFRL